MFGHLKKLKEKVRNRKLRCRFFSYSCKLCQIENRMLHIYKYICICTSVRIDVSTSVHVLAEVQMFAYTADHYRSSNGILRFTLQSSVFVMYYSEIFYTKSLKSTTPKGMYGATYYSVVWNLPMMFRYISLRSVISEASECTFGNCR